MCLCVVRNAKFIWTYCLCGPLEKFMVSTTPLIVVNEYKLQNNIEFPFDSIC